jgi:hypothetical protein
VAAGERRALDLRTVPRVSATHSDSHSAALRIPIRSAGHVAPRLLSRLKEIAEIHREMCGKRDYCLAVKGNQPTLHEGIIDFLKAPG